MLATRLAPIVLLCAALLGCAEGLRQGVRDPSGALAREFGDFVRDRLRATGTVGMSVALIDGDKTLLAEGYGFSDRSRRIRARADTPFRVGSVTKLFTATAIMRLVEEGRLDLDRPLQAYIPEFSMRSRFPESAPMTIRALLCHHAGLPTNRIEGAMSAHPKRFSTLVEDLRDESVCYPPFTLYAYSNLAYSLLGVVIERVSGKPYEAFIQQALLDPLGMGRSGFDSRVVGTSYFKGRAFPDWPIRDVPAGGLISTVTDLARFAKAILARGALQDGQRLISEASLLEMMRPQNEKVPMALDFQIGLGWMLRGSDVDWAGAVARHSGSVGRFRSEMALLRDKGLGVVVLANSTEGEAAVQDVATEGLKLVLAARGAPKPSPRPLEAVRPIDLSTAGGAYALPIGTIVAKPNGNRLDLDFQGLPFAALPRSDGGLALRLLLLGVVPVEPELIRGMEPSFGTLLGKPFLFVRRRGFITLGERLEPTPIPEAWRRMEGRYQVANLGGAYKLVEAVTLREKAGFLYLDIQYIDDQRELKAMRALTDSEAILPGYGRGLGETISRDEETLKYSGMILVRQGSAVSGR